MAEYGIRPRAGALRAPTRDEVRAAIRSLAPVEVREQAGARWYADVRFGPVDDGFEVSVTADSVSVRGGGDEQIRALGRAPAAAVGPLVAVRASEDTPELIEPV